MKEYDIFRAKNLEINNNQVYLIFSGRVNQHIYLLNLIHYNPIYNDEKIKTFN